MDTSQQSLPLQHGGGGQQDSLPPRLLRNEQPGFDVLDWFSAYESCQKFFLDHAQHSYETRALAAMVNILLPCQWRPPVTTFLGQGSGKAHASLHAYVRRLVVTGFDTDGVMHGLFGDDWQKGVGPLQECERRNYLFAAKSTNWAAVKAHYDMPLDQSTPFLRPLRLVNSAELEGAEKGWSDWLYMQDWMIGSRAPSSEPDAEKSAREGHVVERRRSHMTG